MTTIHTEAGTVFINPGTEPVADSHIEQAYKNAQRLAEDTDSDLFAEDQGNITEDSGRFLFVLRNQHGALVEVEMPGIPLDEVRYMGEPDQDIWDFPRLYVDGSSWVWKYAISAVQRVGAEEER